MSAEDISAAYAAGLCELRTLLGARLSSSPSVRDQHGADPTGHFKAAPDAVAFATSTTEVSAITCICSAHKMPIIPYGCGTSLEGQVAAVHGGVCIDLSGMNQMVELNSSDLDCRVEAGVTLRKLNESIRQDGLFFPVDPGADASLGGMAATRASGTNAVRYGTMSHNVLGLTVVLASGAIIRTGTRARKSAAGYDLTRLFVGSEGTLGVITEVQLKLYPFPSSISAAVSSFSSLRGAVDTVLQTLHCGVPIARIELLDEVLMEAVNRRGTINYPALPTLFFEFQGTTQSVEEQVQIVGDLVRENGGAQFEWALLPEERTRLWRARHEAFWAARDLRPGCTPIATDVCVPISSLTECVLETKNDIQELPFPAPVTGHVGDGNFHVLLLMDAGSPSEAAAAESFNRRLIERAHRYGGTCTGEHGVGLGKIDYLEWEAGSSLSCMRAIKAALDPDGILNPGKIFRT